MSYGIEIFNNSGKTLIDDNSRQVQILKTGTSFPTSIGGGVSGTGSGSVSGVIVSGPKSSSLIFIRAKRTSGSRNNAILQVGVYLGKCNYTWTSTAATTVGTNFIYASPTVGSASVDSISSYVSHTINTTTINDDHTADTIGDQVGNYGNWANGFSTSSPIITKIETTGTSGVYKVYLNGTWNSSLASGTASKTIEKAVAFFHSGHNRRFDPSWGSSTTADFTLEYKMGQLSNNAEESSGYGVEVFKSDGTLAFSSNRENFQITSIVTGKTDMAGVGTGTSQSGEFVDNGTLPFIYSIVADPSNFADYWAIVSVSGNTGAFVQGSGQNQGPGASERTISFAGGYVFLPPGNGAFDNRGMGYVWENGSETSIGSSNAGIGLGPMLATLENNAPQISQGSYVSDTWAYDATRSLAIGKFV